MELEVWLRDIGDMVALVIEAMALVIIVMSSIVAFAGCMRIMFTPNAPQAEKRAIWLRYARWLIAALTFQLAADVIETAISPTWDDIGRLGAIAVIRTFLNYFLERDVEEIVGTAREPRERSGERP